MSPEFTQTQLAQLMQDFYKTVLHQENIGRMTGPGFADEVREQRAAHYAVVAASARNSLACNRLADADTATSMLLQNLGFSLHSLSEIQLAQARQAVLRAGIEVAESLERRYLGDFSHEPRDNLLKLTLDGAVADPLPSPSMIPSQPSHVDTAAEVFSTRSEAFRQAQILRQLWADQTAMQAKATYRIFIEVCGDRPLASYVRADAKLMRMRLERLPFDYSKHPRYRDCSVDEILARHAALPLNAKASLLSGRTVQRHFSVLSALWIDALEADEVSENIFEGFHFAAGKRAVDQRQQWEIGDLKQFFTSPVWTGCESIVRRSRPGTVILKDEKYWIPLIAVLSGMRQEEICQLRAGDVREQDGIWFFDVNSQSGGKLKNRSATRAVPIHDALIRLGFVSYVEKTGHGNRAIFPNLKPGGADKRLGHSFAKWFTRYRRDVGLYRKMLDFHSFRHTATTLMHQAGAGRVIIDHVTGHATPGETSRYTKGSSLQQLKTAIDGIDASFLDMKAMV